MIDGPVIPQAVALLKKADECFGLAKVQQGAAEKQHDNAARQLDLARKQQLMGQSQHQLADEMESNSQTLKQMGEALKTHAATKPNEHLANERRNDPPKPVVAVSE